MKKKFVVVLHFWVDFSFLRLCIR